MIWITLLFVILIAIFLLVFWLMKDYQDLPSKSMNYSLYLIRNPNALNAVTLERIYLTLRKQNNLISIERLQKGSEKALLLFAPESLVSENTELQPLELEEYFKADDLKDINFWQLTLKSKDTSKLEITQNIFQNLNLSDNQQIFFQLVIHPLKSPVNNFQVTLRVGIKTKDAVPKTNLSLRLNSNISLFTNLERKKSNKTSNQIGINYLKRGVVPKEIAPFTLNSQQILSLIF